MSDRACMNASVSNIASGKIDLHFVLKRDTEQQSEITNSSVPYGIFSWDTFHTERELLLWLSCFIIFAPWILAHCETAADKPLTFHLSDR